jgi:hypothetical protein
MDALRLGRRRLAVLDAEFAQPLGFGAVVLRSAVTQARVEPRGCV